jgi:hypothetical protein
MRENKEKHATRLARSDVVYVERSDGPSRPADAIELVTTMTPARARRRNRARTALVAGADDELEVGSPVGGYKPN